MISHVTEPVHDVAARIAYDTVAASYADVLRDHLAGHAWDRAVLSVFAEVVQANGGGAVLDVGCGPGRLTRPLHDLGLDVAGVDLSPAMVEVARRDHPDLRFTVGSLTALDVADGALAGLVAWYSIIHTPDDGLPALFAELARVLATGGHLLLAFQAGNAVRHVTNAYGHDVAPSLAHRRPPEVVLAAATSAGFTSKPASTEPRNHPRTYPRPTCCYAEPDAARRDAGAGRGGRLRGWRTGSRRRR